jgi:trimethylamine--corrinoid protein Co-methyltransferase
MGPESLGGAGQVVTEANYIGYRGPQFHILSDSQIQHVHQSALEMLERVGVAFESEEARSLLADAGAHVSPSNRVRIPSWLVEESLRTTCKTIVLYTTAGLPAFTLNGRNGCHFGAVPNPREIVDPQSGQRRACFVEDIAGQARLIQRLPNIEWAWTGTSNLTLPLVGDDDFAGRVSLATYVRHCTKPLSVETNTLASLKEVLEVCYLVAGGRDAFLEKPFFISSSEPVSPLVQGKEALAKSLFCAENSIPNIIYGMPMAGATAPATLEGCLAVALAEILSHLTVVQVKKPGARVVLGAIPSIMDMRTTIYSYGAPEMSLMVGALTEVVHSYGLPMFGTAGCTDADIVGVQAATEVTYQVMTSMLTGADLVHDVGVFYHATSSSPELTCLVNDIVGMVRVLCGGLNINDETVPLELLDRLGPGANLLGEQHTFRHFKEFWSADLFDRSYSDDGGRVHCEDRLKRRTLESMQDRGSRCISGTLDDDLAKLESSWLGQMGLKQYPQNSGQPAGR